MHLSAGWFRRALPPLLAGAGIIAAGCTGERPNLAEPTPTTAAAETTTTLPKPTGVQVAEAKDSSIDVFVTEDAVEPSRQLESGVDTVVDTIPLVFLVKSTGTERLEVYLPVRPNGSLGWVDSSAVTVTRVHYRIEVRLGEHRIRVFEDDDVVVDEPVGVGRADVPTPGGIYYVKELLQAPDPTGAYGTYAYGLSGFSNELTNFNGGTGVIGIHGTNDPSSIGTDVSNGCIRLHNDLIERLVEDIGLPLGTPVEILA